MIVKTVVVTSINKLHSLMGSENPALLVSFFPLGEEKVRLNLHQKEGVEEKKYRQYIESFFKEEEIKSMY